MDFDNIFSQSEYSSLKGESKKGFWILCAIIFLTFTALGLVLGGVNQLNERMNDPFTNWISIPVTGANEQDISDLIDDFEMSTAMSDRFNVRSIVPYQIAWLKVFDSRFSKTTTSRVRTIAGNDSLSMTLLSSNNVILNNSERAFDDCNIVVTQELCDLLGYEPSQISELYFYDRDYSDELAVSSYNISHVVKDLPDNAQILITDKLMSLMDSRVENSGFINQDARDETKFLIKQDQFDELAIHSELGGSFNIKDINIKESVNDRIKVISLMLDTVYPFYELLEKKRDFVKSHREYLNYLPIHCTSYSGGITPYYYSINFNRLDSVKSFRGHLKSDYNLELSLMQVESRNNFFLISRLTKLFIWLLVGFSIFSILVFLNSIVLNHIEKIKSNLGTLKAFGLSNTKILKLYIQIVFRFFFTASLYAMTILLFLKLLLYFLGSSESLILFDLRLLLIFALIIASLYFFFKRNLSKVLFRSPGDLIYNR